MSVASSAHAQAPTGTITGVATDSTRAAVAGARVSIINVETGHAWALNTSSKGIYTFAALLPGEYRVTVELTGFKRFDRNATVEAGTTTTVDLALELGAVANSVTVRGAREGNFNIRLVFGTPVVSEPGILESIADFMTPGDIAAAIEARIRRSLSTPGSQTQTFARCTSIGANRAADPASDSALFDIPRQGTGRPTVPSPLADTAVGKSATVRFVRITRKPPAFGDTPPAEPGQFNVFLNGIPGYFPDTPALNLPVAGGSAALNLCKTIDMSGADRLQLIFVNSHGGAVWSQFAANRNFNAGPPRTMTTGRRVVVPGQPGPPNPTTGRSGTVKPQSLLLREFELLYTIEYSAPGDRAEVAPPAGGRGTRPTAPGTILDPGGGGQPSQPCRQI